MKPFNLELAKAGHPVCTRDGHKVRIICFDRKDSNCPIIALLSDGSKETVSSYTTTGYYSKGQESQLDLMMVSEKKEGWINIYEHGVSYLIYETEEEAKNSRMSAIGLGRYVTTIKIEWEG